MTKGPPLDAGALNGTDAVVPSTVAVPTLGAPGAVATGAEIARSDEAEVPAELVAVTVKK